MTKKTELKDVPSKACRLRGDFIKLEVAAQVGEEKARRRFKMTAYTGKVVYLWYWGNYVVDLKGVQFKQTLPVLMDHDVSLRVGFSEKVTVSADAITAEGLFLSNENAQTILRDGDEGFPWQVSIGVDHVEMQRLFDGETAEVNGQTVQGPCLIARKTVLREMSMLALGADDDTTAAAAGANDGPTVKVAITENQREEPMGDTTIPKTALTAAQVREAHPTQVAELCTAAAAGAAQAAVAAERDRVQAILTAADPLQHDLAQTLVKDGTSASEALGKLNADLKVKLAAARSTTLGGKQTTTSLSGGNGAPLTEGEGATAKLRAQFPSDERGEKAFQAYLKRNPITEAAAT